MNLFLKNTLVPFLYIKEFNLNFLSLTQYGGRFAPYHQYLGDLPPVRGGEMLLHQGLQHPFTESSYLEEDDM